MYIFFGAYITLATKLNVSLTSAQAHPKIVMSQRKKTYQIEHQFNFSSSYCNTKIEISQRKNAYHIGSRTSTHEVATVSKMYTFLSHA